jgi:hypothetical protein
MVAGTPAKLSIPGWDLTQASWDFLFFCFFKIIYYNSVLHAS